ncbi:MAG: RHS repeat-associated core domain-containing protein, partial [Thermoanaerobaculia bacterium]
ATKFVRRREATPGVVISGLQTGGGITWTRRPWRVCTPRNAYRNDAGTGLVFTDVTDPNGRLTRQGYDQFGQLGRAVDTAGNTTQYGYTNGRLTSITDANNNVTSYQYNTARQLQKTTFPDSLFETYAYWGDGVLRLKTDRKNQMVNTYYDHFKRVTQTGYLAQNYTYVGQKLTQVFDQSVNPYETTNLSYDTSYRLWSVTEGARGTVNYQYNGDDTVLSTSVQSGPSTTYAYYPDGSLNTIVWSQVSGNFKYRYTLTGQYQSVTMPSGATRNFTYDDQGRLTSLTNLKSDGMNLATYAYGYDLNYTTGLNTMLGQRVSLTASVPSQNLSSHLFKYEYDPAYELNKVTYPNVAPFSGEVDSWAYDNIGSRTSSTVNAVTTNYTYQKIGANPLNWQRLTSDGSNSYTYDNNGNTMTRGATAFTWNAEDQMTGITGTSSYVYDYQGRRSSKTVGASTSTYLYDGANLIQEAGATPADYLFGPGIDEPLAMRRGGSTYYYDVDGLGSVTLVTDSGGTVQDKYLYDTWGQIRSSTTPVANPFGYTSREFGEAQTMFYRARYYQPAVGRFLSEDPIAADAPSLFGGAGLYAYVSNDPIDYLDPDGLFEVKKGVPRPSPILVPFLHCLERALGLPIVVTSTTEGYHKDPGHKGGTSVDIRPTRGATWQKVFCVAADCGAASGLNEVTNKVSSTQGDNYHFQLQPRRDRARGDLPPCPSDCTLPSSTGENAR